MNNKQRTKKCFTLVEILIVVAIIAILATMVVGIATRISNQSKEQLTKNTFALLNAALGQFRDYGYQYRNPAYSDFDFPLDCNDFDNIGLADTVQNALGLPAGSVSIIGIDKQGVEQGVDDNLQYSGCEALYFFLSRVLECRKTLDKIDNSLVTNKGSNGNVEVSRTIIVNGKYFPLLRIIDPWGTTLHYDYYDELDFNYARRNKGKRTFPEIISAGPDRIFGTGDDITSR